jgi:hypothetical protein
MAEQAARQRAARTRALHELAFHDDALVSVHGRFDAVLMDPALLGQEPDHGKGSAAHPGDAIGCDRHALAGLELVRRHELASNRDDVAGTASERLRARPCP